MVYVNIVSQLSPILGLWQNGGYLLVSDYRQQKVYQLKPDTGEVRAIPLRSCRPFSLAVDPSRNCFYVICLARNNIRKITFDSKVNEVIYNASPGKKHFLYCYRITLCLKNSPLLFLWLLGQILIDFNYMWSRCSWENLQTHDIFLSYNIQFVYEYYRIEILGLLSMLKFVLLSCQFLAISIIFGHIAAFSKVYLVPSPQPLFGNCLISLLLRLLEIFLKIFGYCCVTR